MSLLTKLVQFGNLLTSKGFHEEAKMLKRVSHYVPEDTEGVPSFFRRNYDYGPEGDSFYYGNMSEKEPLGEWRKKHKNKGPNWPKKKKSEKQAQTLVPENEDWEARFKSLVQELDATLAARGLWQGDRGSRDGARLIQAIGLALDKCRCREQTEDK